MKHKMLALPEEHILAEQLRLLYKNLNSAPASILAMVGVLVWALSTSSNWGAMSFWGITIVLLTIVDFFRTKRALASNIPPGTAFLQFREEMAFSVMQGIAWGSLAWVALDTNSVVNTVLVVTVIAGVGSNITSLSSSLFQTSLVFVIPEFASLALALWVYGGPEFLVLIFCVAVYAALLILYAKNAAEAARAAIDLRFENIDLIQRLRVETAKAEDASLAKSKFLAAASHDLRQPIHALGLYLEALMRSELSPRQRQTLEKASVVSEATSEILNALLDFSRIEAGVIQPQTRSFRLQPLLNKIEQELAPQADAKELFYRTRETHLAVYTDPVLLKLMLRNLVMNAIRYTKRGGILVACRRRDDHVLLEVWDTGIGIAPSQQSEIFREFHQLGNSERDHRKGLGLGLSIVDRLAQKLGLPLTLASRPQRGSVFSLMLPVAHEAVAINDFETTQINVRNLNARVLVIDDDEAVRDGMVNLLCDWNCECVAVESIEEALASIKSFVPDLVISDYRLRDRRTGAEAITALRAERGMQLPAILITGDTAPERLREALASGIPLLHKPVSPTQLNQSLVELLTSRETPELTT